MTRPVEVRLTDEMISALDAEAARLQSTLPPPVRVRRADAIRSAIARGLGLVPSEPSK